MEQTVLIIGNGFDLDLGLKTKYIDFANSSYWPFKFDSTEFAEFLNKKKADCTWFDLEKLIGEYACDPTHLNGDTKKRHFRTTTEADVCDYKTLCNSLTEYIQYSQESEIDLQSVASKLLLQVLKNRKDTYSIYSFNYTDLQVIAGKMNHYDDFNYHHVHGSLKDNNIILGCGDEDNITKGYEFMRKSFNVNYKPPQILFDLLDSDTIIFFGLSFGSIDYAYFNLFFDKVAQIERTPYNTYSNKHIHIFTYDEKSRMEILHNIHERTNKKLSQINVINDLNIYRTNEAADKKKIEEFIYKTIK